MDIHVDHPERSTDFYGQPTMPNILLAGTQLLAVDFLGRCMRDMEPLAALTGGAGTGKTTALNTALARQESAGERVIRVNNFVAGPLSLHRVLAASIGVADAGELSAEELEPVLRKALAGIGQADPPILAVDDAQSLLPETLRYLCLLGGLREAGQPLFRILLVGRPGFTVRQPIPVHFTLEAMQPHAAREIVEHGLAAAGVTATSEKIRDLIQGAQGNLRTLASLLQAYIEEARRGGRRRMTTAADAGPAEAMSRKPRPVRRRSSGAWLVVPALLVVGAAGAAIVYHDGAGTRHDDTPVAIAPAPPPRPTAAAPAAELPTASPAVPPPAAAGPPPVSALPPPSGAAAPVIPAPVGPAPLPSPARSASGDAGNAAMPTPVVPSPIGPAAPALAPPAVATASPAPVAVPPPRPASPRPSPDQVAPDQPQQPSSQASVPPAVPVQQAAHFRVYNISACHHGVCPRWSVTDLDQRSRFVAAFDLSALHLDRDTTRRLREGAVDIIVDGSVTRGGPDGRTLVAGTLQGVAPHHGLLHPSSSEPVDLAAPPQAQSPPPGFLAMPAASPSAAPLPLTPPQ